MVKVAELRGLKSVWAFNAYYSLVYGLAVEQAHLGQEIETTFAKFEALPAEKKQEQLRHALKIVNLSKDDMMSLLTFAIDANGIPYAQRDTDKMAPQEILDALLAVCVKLAELKPRTADESVKKN